MRSCGIWGAIGAFMLIGCGGSGGGAIGGGEVERDYGSVTTRTAGAVGPPLNIATNDLTVVGLAGASFSLARLNFPPPTALNTDEVLNRTQIAIDYLGQPALYDWATGEVVRVSRDVSNSGGFRHALSPLGDRIYSTEFGTKNRIFQTNIDGTGRIYLTSASESCSQPDVSPDGSKLVFERVDASGRSQICTMPATAGGAIVQLTSASSNCFRPQWSADGTKIAFGRVGSGGNGEIWTMNANGSGAAIFGSMAGVSTYYECDYTPTGEMVVTYADSEGPHIGRIGKTGGVPFPIYSPTVQPFGVSVSPEGSQVSFIGWAGSNYDLFTMPIEGDTPVRRTFTGSVFETNWGPYIRAKSLIGNGGALSTGAGYLLAQKGRQFPSYVVFDATTRSGVTIEGASQQFQGNIVVTVKASDNLTALRYSNNLFAPAIAVVTSSAPVSGAMVSFDAASGEVASVIPFTGTTPTLKATRGSERTYEGKFLGVWDRNGVNVAPHGTTTVTLGGR